MKSKLLLGLCILVFGFFITTSQNNTNSKTSVYGGISKLQQKNSGYGSATKDNEVKTVMHSNNYPDLSAYTLALKNINNRSRELQILGEILSETLILPTEDQPKVIVAVLKRQNDIEYLERICVNIYADGPRCIAYKDLVRDSEELTRESVKRYITSSSFVGFFGRNPYNHDIDKKIRGGGICGYVATARSLYELGVVNKAEFTKDGKISYDFLKQVHDSEQSNNIGDTFKDPSTQKRADAHENIAKEKGKSVICKNAKAPALLPGETEQSPAAEKRLTEWCNKQNMKNVDNELLMYKDDLDSHAERIKSAKIKKVTIDKKTYLVCEVTAEDGFEQGGGVSGTRYNPSDATRVPATGANNVYSVYTSGYAFITKGEDAKNYYKSEVFIDDSLCCELKQ